MYTRGVQGNPLIHWDGQFCWMASRAGEAGSVCWSNGLASSSRSNPNSFSFRPLMRIASPKRSRASSVITGVTSRAGERGAGADEKKVRAVCTIEEYSNGALGQARIGQPPPHFCGARVVRGQGQVEVPIELIDEL